MESKIILTDETTALRKAHAEKYKGVRELSEFICKRVRGEIGDILLPDEQRVEGLILDWVKEVEKRMENNFQIGQFVRLNSGSPYLEVVGITKDKITATWLNERNVLEEITAPPVCFKSISSPQE